MAGPASKRAPNRSKRPTLARKAKTLPPKSAAQRKRTGLTPEKKSILDGFDAKKHGSLRAFCEKHDIPRSSARYHLETADARELREQKHAKIVKTVKKLSRRMRVKGISCRVSGSEIKNKAASCYTPQHINRIIRSRLGRKPRRRPQTGQPNAESTESQMRTINAHRRYL